MAARGPRFLSNGVIQPATFVKQDVGAGNNFMVIQAAAITDKIIGISQQGPYNPPGTINASTAATTAAGQELIVYGEGEETLLQIAATIATGTYLTSNASGQGIAVAFTLGANTLWAGAIALESGISGDWIRVLVAIRPLPGITA
jgi:hypothetical protein